MMRLLLSMCVCLAVAAPVGAAAPVKTAGADPRFQTLQYTNDVIKVPTQIGRILEIEFDKSETSIEFAMGDREGWQVKLDKNVMYLKPKSGFPDTNLKVITNKRSYWFELAMATKKAPAVWHVGFKYPYEAPLAVPIALPDPAVIAAKNAARQRKTIEERLGADLNPQVVPVERELNGNYEVLGPRDITPTSAYDNGESTAMTFVAGKPMPAVFVIEDDGTEGRVPFHVEGNMLVIHRVAKRLVLTRGTQRATMTNHNYRPTGTNGTTNTISDYVRRDLKGAAEE